MAPAQGVRVGNLFGITIYYNSSYGDSWKRLCSDALIKERLNFQQNKMPISHGTFNNDTLKLYPPVSYDDPRVSGIKVR